MSTVGVIYNTAAATPSPLTLLQGLGRHRQRMATPLFSCCGWCFAVTVYKSSVWLHVPALAARLVICLLATSEPPLLQLQMLRLLLPLVFILCRAWAAPARHGHSSGGFFLCCDFFDAVSARVALAWLFHLQQLPGRLCLLSTNSTSAVAALLLLLLLLLPLLLRAWAGTGKAWPPPWWLRRRQPMQA
jgi:hypothetical protein